MNLSNTFTLYRKILIMSSPFMPVVIVNLVSIIAIIADTQNDICAVKRRRLS